MRWLSRITLIAALLTAACEPPKDPGPAPGEGTGGGTDGGSGGSGDGGSGGGDAEPPSSPPPTTPATPPPTSPEAPPPTSRAPDATSTFTLAVDRVGAPDHVTAVDLETVALGLFREQPTWRDDDSSCGGGAEGLVPLDTTVALDLTEAGRTPVASVDLDGEGKLREVWLVLRKGVLHRDGRAYKVHAGALCTMSDGLQYTLLRLDPGSPIAFAGGADFELVVPFDARSAIREEHVDCRSSGAEECQSSDDAFDDGDPDTRLRYTFEPDLPLRASPR